MNAKLIVIGGRANKNEVQLHLPTVIGRSKKADLTVAHPKVSRKHCELFEREGALFVRDSGSLNGTFLGEDRVTEALVKPGDKLTIGPLTFVAVYELAGSDGLPVEADSVATPPVEPVADEPSADDFDFLADEPPRATQSNSLPDTTDFPQSSDSLHNADSAENKLFSGAADVPQTPTDAADPIFPELAESEASEAEPAQSTGLPGSDSAGADNQTPAVSFDFEAESVDEEPPLPPGGEPEATAPIEEEPIAEDADEPEMAVDWLPSDEEEPPAPETPQSAARPESPERAASSSADEAGDALPPTGSEPEPTMTFDSGSPGEAPTPTDTTEDFGWLGEREPASEQNPPEVAAAGSSSSESAAAASGTAEPAGSPPGGSEPAQADDNNVDFGWLDSGDNQPAADFEDGPSSVTPLPPLRESGGSSQSNADEPVASTSPDAAEPADAEEPVDSELPGFGAVTDATETPAGGEQPVLTDPETPSAGKGKKKGGWWPFDKKKAKDKSKGKPATEEPSPSMPAEENIEPPAGEPPEPAAQNEPEPSAFASPSSDQDEPDFTAFGEPESGESKQGDDDDDLANFFKGLP